MPSLHPFLIGGGQVTYDAAQGNARLVLPPPPAQRYGDAQLDDYHHAPRVPFANAPPLRMKLRARASHAQPVGTLGFGFWNNPFSLTGGLVFAAPSVVWFFYASPPSDMALVEGVPGFGWKAATLDAGRWPSWLLAPAALGAIGLTFIPGLGRPIMATARRMVRTHEAALGDVALNKWHDYALEWRAVSAVSEAPEAIFWVDGVERLRAPAPRGPLGFVLWIDNQFAVASRAGRFGFGLCPVPEAQWLEVEGLEYGRFD